MYPGPAFGSVTGQGVRAAVAGRSVLVGSARLLAGAGIEATALEAAAAELSGQGKTPVLVAVDGKPAGVLAIADTVKDDSAAAIAALRRLGVQVVMLTGAAAPEHRGAGPFAAYFCSAGSAAFDADPGRYAAAPTHTGGLYVRIHAEQG